MSAQEPPVPPKRPNEGPGSLAVPSTPPKLQKTQAGLPAEPIEGPPGMTSPAASQDSHNQSQTPLSTVNSSIIDDTSPGSTSSASSGSVPSQPSFPQLPLPVTHTAAPSPSSMAHSAPSHPLHPNDEDDEEDDTKEEETVFAPTDPVTWPIEQKRQLFFENWSAGDSSKVVLATGVPWEVYENHDFSLKLCYNEGTVTIISVPNDPHGAVTTEIAGHFRDFTKFFPHLVARENCSIPILGRHTGRDADVKLTVILPDQTRHASCVVEVNTSGDLTLDDVRQYVVDYLIRNPDVRSFTLLHFYHTRPVYGPKGPDGSRPLIQPPLPTGAMIAVQFDRPAVEHKDPDPIHHSYLNLQQVDDIRPIWARSFGTSAPPASASDIFPELRGVGLSPVDLTDTVLPHCNALGQHMLVIPSSRIYYGRALPHPPKAGLAFPYPQLLEPVLQQLPAGHAPNLRIDLFRIQCAFMDQPPPLPAPHPFDA